MKYCLLFIPLVFFSCKNDGEIIDKTDAQVESTIVSPNSSGSEDISFDIVDTTHVELTQAPSNYTVKVFEHENGWGYQIFDGDKLVINQKHIPSVPGINGFSSEEKALKTSDYVKAQLDKDIFPPTVTPEILDSLGVL